MPKTQLPTTRVVPLGNRIVITPRPEKTQKKDLQSIGGIFIPEAGSTGKVDIEPYYLAEVLAAGPECKTVKKGDTIIAVRTMDWRVVIDGEILAYMMRENEVHGIVKKFPR